MNDILPDSPDDVSLNQLEPAESLHPFNRENLLTFKGRMNRMDFAILSLTLTLLILLLQKYVGANPISASIASMIDPENMTPQMSTVLKIGQLGFIGFLLIAFKRFHDLEYSGFFSLLLVVPFIGFIIRLILYFAPGVAGANKFGNPPIANHRNKVLILITLLALIFMVYKGFSSDAKPYIDQLMQHFEQLVEESS